MNQFFVFDDEIVTAPLKGTILPGITRKSVLEICRDWEKLSNKLCNAYQEQALAELDYKGKPLKFSKLLRKLKKREKEKGKIETVILRQKNYESQY